MKPRKQVIVGTYEIGMAQAELVLRPGTGGEFYTAPELGKVARIKLGADLVWFDIVCNLLHEAFELQMTLAHCRFNPAPDFARDHSSYVFLMTHPQFSDIAASCAPFIASCLPDLALAAKKWRKRK